MNEREKKVKSGREKGVETRVSSWFEAVHDIVDFVIFF
jgi:hypothetical protein